MKSILKQLLSDYLRWRYRKKVTYIGSGQKFYRTTKLNISKGSKLVLHENTRVHCSISCLYGGEIEMEKWVKMGPEGKILSCNYVRIGAYTAIGRHVTICDNNNHPVDPEFRRKMRVTPEGHDMRSWRHSDSKPIIIGENVWVGEDVRICKGVTIGDNAVIAACSVVTKDVPPNSIAAGNPAKIVKTDIHIKK